MKQYTPKHARRLRVATAREIEGDARFFANEVRRTRRLGWLDTQIATYLTRCECWLPARPHAPNERELEAARNFIKAVA